MAATLNKFTTIVLLLTASNAGYAAIQQNSDHFVVHPENSMNLYYNLTENLVAAASAGDDFTLQSLIYNGAPIEGIAENGLTALCAAASRGNRRSVEILVSATLASNQTSPQKLENDLTAYHFAAYTGNLSILELLSSLEIPVDQQSAEGATALYLAAEAGKIDAVQFFIRKGANPNLATAAGITPLAIAYLEGFPLIVKALSQASNWNLDNELNLATKYYSPSLVTYLKDKMY